MDSKSHPIAEACLSPESQAAIALRIGDCARHRRDMALADFPGIIAAAAGQGA